MKRQDENVIWFMNIWKSCTIFEWFMWTYEEKRKTKPHSQFRLFYCLSIPSDGHTNASDAHCIFIIISNRFTFNAISVLTQLFIEWMMTYTNIQSSYYGNTGDSITPLPHRATFFYFFRSFSVCRGWVRFRLRLRKSIYNYYNFLVLFSSKP